MSLADLFSQGAGAVLALGGFGLLFMAALGGWGTRHISTPWRVAFAVTGNLLVVSMLAVVYLVVAQPGQGFLAMSLYVVLLIIGLALVLFAMMDWLKLSLMPGPLRIGFGLIGLLLFASAGDALFPSHRNPTTSQIIRATIENYFSYVGSEDFDRAWDLVKDSQWVEGDFGGKRASWQDYVLGHKWEYNYDFYRTIVPYEENKASAKMDISIFDKKTGDKQNAHKGAYVCLLYDPGQALWLINRFNFDGSRCELSNE